MFMQNKMLAVIIHCPEKEDPFTFMLPVAVWRRIVEAAPTLFVSTLFMLDNEPVDFVIDRVFDQLVTGGAAKRLEIGD